MEAAAGQPADAAESDVDDSHEAIWAAMPLTVVRDCSARLPTQPLPAREGRQAASGGDSDEASSTSDESDDSAGNFAALGGWSAAEPGSSASTGPPPQDPHDVDDEESMLQDLMGLAGEGGASMDGDLPTLEEERRRLGELVARRQAVREIAARYTGGPPPEHRPFAPLPRPAEVTRQRPDAAPAALDAGWATVGAKATAAAAVRSSLRVDDPSQRAIAGAPSGGASQGDGLPTRGEDLVFTALDVLDGPGATEEVRQEASRLAAGAGAAPAAGARYAVRNGPASEQPPEEDAAGTPGGADGGAAARAAVAAGEDGEPSQGLAPFGAAAVATGGGAPPLRPWAPATGPTFGPAAPPNPAQATALLRQLGSRFREQGLGDGRPAAGGTEAMISALGARFGHLGDPLPTKVAGGAGAAARDAAVEPATRPAAAASGGGKAAEPAQVGEQPAAAALAEMAVRPVDDALGGPTVAAWPCSPDKLRTALERDERLRGELWAHFLAGDDRPVGGDALPPPDLYYAAAAGPQLGGGRLLE